MKEEIIICRYLNFFDSCWNLIFIMFAFGLIKCVSSIWKKNIDGAFQETEKSITSLNPAATDIYQTTSTDNTLLHIYLEKSHKVGLI